MDEYISADVARQIMGNQFIGPDELASIKEINLKLSSDALKVPFAEELLREKSKDYFLIYGASQQENGSCVNIMNLKSIFGMEPRGEAPCFYFQDWYDKEDFAKKSMDEGWFFIRKNVFEDSRAVRPEELMGIHQFPTAIRATYAFFVVWLVRNERLWYHDFIWCSDTDHNGDRIYVGKYNDIDGINKDGFSIHRHLALRQCYACVD